MTEARRATLKAEAQLKELARQHTAEAVETLVALMNDTSTPPAARVAAIKEILDRGHGKATQVVAGDPDNPLVVQQIAFKVIDPRH